MTGGKKKPERKILGSIVNMVSNIASCWVLAIVEIKMPKPKVVRIKRAERASKRDRLPLIGTPKSSTPATRISTVSKKAIKT